MSVRCLLFIVIFASLVLLLLCGRAIAASATKAPMIKPNDLHLQYIGRFDFRDPAGPRCAWSASTVSIRFHGRSLQALMVETGQNLYQVVVDGQATKVLRPGPGENLLDVASDLADGDHTVAIVKRTEAVIGMSQFKGFYLPDGGKLLDNPASLRRIEVIGDSISCGYGNEAASEKEPFTPETENAYLAYGAVAARLVGADYTCIAWSGRKLWPDNTIPEIYDRTLPFDPTSQWSFDKAPIPDVVLINLATNDFAAAVPDAAGWTGAYVDFVRRIRTHYPKAAIYLASGSMMSDFYPEGKRLSVLKGYLDEVQAALRKGGDTNVRVLHFDPQDGAVDGMGANFHPSAKTDAKMAEMFAEALVRDLQWIRAGARSKSTP